MPKLRLTPIMSVKRAADLTRLSKSKAPMPASTVADRKALGHLAQESFEIAMATLLQLGMSKSEIGRAMKRTFRSPSKSQPSGELLARYTQLGLMLNGWRRDKRYSNSDGIPKVIPIHGKGVTFEALARKSAPGVPVEQFVDLICRQGDATRSAGDKLALLGSNVLIFAKTPLMTMAALNDNFRNLANTILRNMQEVGSKGPGLFQRKVSGHMTERVFQKFVRDVRPELQQLCSVVESAVDDGKEATGHNRRRCGMSVYLFQESDR